MYGPIGPTALRERAAAERMQQLLNQSESSGLVRRVERPTVADQPSHLTPDRVHGGIDP
jgi:hypothetical protein